MHYSVLIKNGFIVDGVGTPPHIGDIGIVGKTIKDIGTLSGDAQQIIDAKDCFVAPGFIDLTNHSDVYGTLFTIPSQDSLLMQGITTILVGNCGYSLAPLVKKESLQDLERWTNNPNISINWGSLAEYYDTLKHMPLGINVATLVGHETLRKNAGTLDERLLLCERAFTEGAWGLSSNFSFIGWSDEVAQETQKLLQIVKHYDGLYKVHIGDEGQNILPATASVISLARESGVRTVLSHMKAIGRSAWKDFKKVLAMIERASHEGIDVSFDMFPYLRTGSMMLSLLPPWAREGSSNEIMRRLADPQSVAYILNDLQKMTLHPDRIMVASALREKTIIGKTLDEIAQNLATTAEEAIIAILKTNSLNATIFGKTLHGKNLLRAIKSDRMILATDGAGYNLEFQASKDLVHPRSFGSHPRFIHRIAPLANIPIEAAVARATSLPARALGLSDRGKITENMVADIVIFNKIEFADAARYHDPYHYASGVLAVLIGGNIAVGGNSTQTQRYGTTLVKSVSH